MHLSQHSKVSIGLLLAALAALVGALLVSGEFLLYASQASGSGSFIGRFRHVSTITSTVPSNGDVNPYGTFVVRHSIGNLIQGHVLVSNFNNKKNLSGTGSTIVEISPNGALTLFAQLKAADLHGACPGGVGLTTALVALERGWVIVGSLPTTNGLPATAKAGCLIVLNSQGRAVETFSGDGINGPWDMTVSDNGKQATLFVTNVLKGAVAAKGKVVHTATVLRIVLTVPNQGNGIPSVQSTTVIGSGFPTQTNAAATVIGPTGVGLGSNGTLYVADTVNSRIAAISNALTRTTSASTGRTVSVNGALNGPLGLTIAPNGDIVTVNGGDGFMVETTPGGTQVAKKLVDRTKAPGAPPGAGCLFGVAVRDTSGVYFVDDCSVTLDLLH
jgi:hypothetical protein